MSTEENKATIRELFATIDREQSMDAAADRYGAANYIGHFPGAPTMDSNGFKAFGNTFFAACPGLSHSLEDVIGEGDIVSVHMVIKGRQTQPFMTPNGTLPASGKDFALQVQNTFHFTDGKIAEQWAAFDMLGFLQDIGAMPQ